MKCRECNKSLSNQGYIHLDGTNDYFCYNCMPSMQPERSKREDYDNICWACNFKIGMQQSCYRCGTLNTIER